MSDKRVSAVLEPTRIIGSRDKSDAEGKRGCN